MGRATVRTEQRLEPDGEPGPSGDGPDGQDHPVMNEVRS